MFPVVLSIMREVYNGHSSSSYTWDPRGCLKGDGRGFREDCENDFCLFLMGPLTQPVSTASHWCVSFDVSVNIVCLSMWACTVYCIWRTVCILGPWSRETTLARRVLLTLSFFFSFLNLKQTQIRVRSGGAHKWNCNGAVPSYTVWSLREQQDFHLLFFSHFGKVGLWTSKNAWGWLRKI